MEELNKLFNLTNEQILQFEKYLDGIIDFDFVDTIAKQIKRCTEEGISWGMREI